MALYNTTLQSLVKVKLRHLAPAETPDNFSWANRRNPREEHLTVKDEPQALKVMRGNAEGMAFALSALRSPNRTKKQTASRTKQRSRQTGKFTTSSKSIQKHMSASKERSISMLMQQEVPQYPVISVLIPARNEARNLEYVLPKIPSIVGEVILIDGDSTDDTIAVAQKLLPSIRIVKQLGKGKGDAIRAGLAASTGEIIVMLDADGSADPDEIPRFIEVLLTGNDFAKGSRFARGGRSHDITFLRSAGNYWLCKLVNLLYGAHFTDLCYGYNAFWRRCFDHMNIDSDGFEIETLINIRMHLARFKIVEVNSVEYPRIHGVSNLHAFRDGWRVLKTILRERGSKASPTPQQLPYFETAFDVNTRPSAEELLV